MEELWYQNVAYEDAKDLVKENLSNTVAAFIAAGYWLKCIRDGSGYVKDGYQSIWECAETEFGLKISEASRAMSMNDKYSVDGNSPFVSAIYRQYNKSQLQEMLTMSDEQIEQVTPDMTIKDIREIKNHETENPEMIQSGLEEWVRRFVSEEYATLSYVLDTAVDKNISEEMLWEIYDDELTSTRMQDAVLVNERKAHLTDKNTGEIIAEYDYGIVVKEMNRIFQELREGKCCDVAMDSVNTECGEISEEDFVTEIEVVPETEESLNIEFNTDELLRELDDVIDGEYQEILEEKSAYGLTRTEQDLAEHNVGNDISVPCGKNCEELCGRQCWESASDEKEDTGEPSGPALKRFKNNEQRKMWLEDVETWGLWYEDKNIQARYYKYDFPDGCRLIAVKYRYTCPPWLRDDEHLKEVDGEYRDTYYHMIYSEEYRKNQKDKYGIYEKYYTNSTISVNFLIEYLKKLQKTESTMGKIYECSNEISGQQMEHSEMDY